jgi:hypothetical protein
MPDFGIFRGFNDKLFGDKLYAGQLPTQLGLIGSQIFAIDPDYQAVLNYATTQGYTLPSAGQQTLQNQLVVDLKDGGIWDKLDTFRVYATDGDSDFALIDWKRLIDCTGVNSPTFTTNSGFNSDGTSSYIDTNYNPTLNAVNASLNDLSIGFWENAVASGSNSVYSGGDDGSQDILLVQKLQNGNGFIRVNDNTSTRPDSVNYEIGFVIAQRIDATNLEYYTASGLLLNYSVNSTGLNNVNMWDLRFSVVYSTDSPISIGFLGASFTSTQVSDFRTAVTNYMTSI